MADVVKTWIKKRKDINEEPEQIGLQVMWPSDRDQPHLAIDRCIIPERSSVVEPKNGVEMSNDIEIETSLNDRALLSGKTPGKGLKRLIDLQRILIGEDRVPSRDRLCLSSWQ